MSGEGVVIEVTLTWRHLACLAVITAAAAVVLAYYPRLKLAMMREVLRAPLAEVELDSESYEPGDTVRVTVCPAAEARGVRLSVVIEDPEGRAAYLATLEVEDECGVVSFLLRSAAPPGTYRVVVKAGDEVLAVKSFKVEG